MERNNAAIADITVFSFHLSTNGLRPLGSPSFQEWVACGQFIRSVEQSVQFWIGDWLLYGEKAYGKTDYDQAVADTGLDYQTLRIYKYVASALPLSLRRNKLSFHHHKEVANLSPQTQAYLLQQAEAHGWPLHKLKQEKCRFVLEAARPASTPFDPALFCGDSTNLHSLPDASLDMVLTAPDLATTKLSDLKTSLALLEHKLKENSHLYLFTSWRTYPVLLPLIQQYFLVKNLLVWDTGRPVVTEHAPYSHVYECILFAHKGRRHLNGRRDASVFRFERGETSPASPADKPLALLEYLIEKSTQPGEVVCDPFMGAGAVCLAAKNTGRAYVGIEKEKNLYDIACSRLAGRLEK